MIKKRNVEDYKSKCCGASVSTRLSPDFFGDDPKTMKCGTCNFFCMKCLQACDVYVEEDELFDKEDFKNVGC